MNLKIKLIIGIVCLAILTGLGLSLYTQHKRIVNLQHDLEYAVNNNKAYEAENASLNGKLIEFKLTADQLSYSNDSLIQKLNTTRKQLGIKDKQIKELQYLASESRKKDTLRIRDTIFQKGVAIDTTIQDEWSRLSLHAEYPNIINTDYSFQNSTVVIAHSSRVTVDPPKKCWLGRLFQKKQTIVEIDVVQENPYCKNKEQKFIKIIEK